MKKNEDFSDLFVYLVILLLLSLILAAYSCTPSRGTTTYVVVGHQTSFNGDTINLVRKSDQKCLKTPVYPIGTVICTGKLKVQ